MVDEPARFDAGIPAGTAALALRLAEDAAAAATRLTGRTHVVDHPAVLAHLLLPLIVGDDPVSAAPRAAPAGGWVHADVLPDDEALLEVLTDSASDAEALAAAAQECRLPVTPYRAADAAWSDERDTEPPVRRRQPSQVSVLDLTAMWAGPFATGQLAAWGADVVTVEPAMRRDGLRGSPAQFEVLDRGKRRVAWDLRSATDRRAFEAAVARADVLVESFSDRVMGNLGYPADELWRLQPELLVVSIRAFPASSPERGWVAFGRGVHAASGLGLVAGVPHAPSLAYPDPLAGLVALAAVLEGVGQAAPARREVSLGGAVAPLLDGVSRPLGAVDAAALAAAPPGDRRPTGRRHRGGMRPSASATRSTGWRTVSPAAARCIAQPGLALATTLAPERLVARSMAATLRSRIAPASAGCSAE